MCHLGARVCWSIINNELGGGMVVEQQGEGVLFGSLGQLPISLV